MKILAIILVILVGHFALAQNHESVKKFNKSLNEEIKNVIKDNPEMYEEMPLRGPASVDEKSPKNTRDISEKERRIWDQGKQGW